MKRILSVMLAAALLLCAVPAMAQTTYPDGTIQWWATG